MKKKNNLSEKNKIKSNFTDKNLNDKKKILSRSVSIGETITVNELSNKMAVKNSLIIKSLLSFGIKISNKNQIIDQDTAQLIAEEMGYRVLLRYDNELENLLYDSNISEDKLIKKKRAPIVTIMGHVDHGKTSLLDYIRSSKVAFSEKGGITQHIGAYYVKTNNGNMITFIDTPGHAAFSAMRARGTKITDIVIVIVAIDDGIMPQTIEAIKHAKIAKVPIIIAINKIDKTKKNIEQIKHDFSKLGIVPEEWGGLNQFVCISAKSGEGINNLLDAILLQADVLELKTTFEGVGNGIVIESFLNKGKGPIASILVTKGNFNIGDILICGSEYGRIRAMYNDNNYTLKKAYPSMPVAIVGLSGIPLVGDKAIVVKNEKIAKEVVFDRKRRIREKKLNKTQKKNIDNIFIEINKNTSSELNIILKSDVQGSSEAIKDALIKLSSISKNKINIIYSGVGMINEADVALAMSSNAILLGFNVKANAFANNIIKTENLDLRYFSIIYELIDSIKKTINNILLPEFKQKNIGIAEVKNVFHISKLDTTIAGCIILDGIFKLNSEIKIIRNNNVIHVGQLLSIKRFKENVNEVIKGMECGIIIKKYNDIKVGDIIKISENTKK